jgi:general stress protein CsbA
MLFLVLFFTQQNGSAEWYYFICAGLGLGSGISVLYIITSAEQFGTNLRASAATSITNFVRGFTPVLLFIFTLLRTYTSFGYLKSAWLIGIGVMLISLTALYFTKESFGKDLDFVEE